MGLLYLFGYLGPFALLGTVFWIWMLYDCLKTGGGQGGRFTWIWILLFLNVIGAGLYFFIVWMPNHPHAFGNLPWVNRGKLRDALWQAEADAKNIGNAYQYRRLGDIHHQLGNIEAAEAAYRTALEMEPKNVDVLWGTACLAMDRNDFVSARQSLQVLVGIQPDFSYGDASLAYGSVLHELKEFDAAREHLQTHVKSWSHPPAYLMLAEICREQGDNASARDTLERMIIKIKSSPPFQYRKKKKYIHQAEKVLKKLA